jgi:hypothetical protein
MSEEPLPGGNTDGAGRIGGVVHKRASPWTPTVHALLRHLEYAGVDGVPRALGFDDQGRQMLTYLPGEVIGDGVPWPAWVYADSTLVQVGQWMRRIHDATAVFIPPEDERWFTGSTMQPGWIVGHQDAAPYNAVMEAAPASRGGAAAGLLNSARQVGSALGVAIAGALVGGAAGFVPGLHLALAICGGAFLLGVLVTVAWVSRPAGGEPGRSRLAPGRPDSVSRDPGWAGGAVPVRGTGR